MPLSAKMVLTCVAFIRVRVKVKKLFVWGSIWKSINTFKGKSIINLKIGFPPFVIWALVIAHSASTVEKWLSKLIKHEYPSLPPVVSLCLRPPLSTPFSLCEGGDHNVLNRLEDQSQKCCGSVLKNHPKTLEFRCHNSPSEDFLWLFESLISVKYLFGCRKIDGKGTGNWIQQMKNLSVGSRLSLSNALTLFYFYEGRDHNRLRTHLLQDESLSCGSVLRNHLKRQNSGTLIIVQKTLCDFLNL